MRKFAASYLKSFLVKTKLWYEFFSQGFPIIHFFMCILNRNFFFFLEPQLIWEVTKIKTTVMDSIKF